MPNVTFSSLNDGRKSPNLWQGGVCTSTFYLPSTGSQDRHTDLAREIPVAAHAFTTGGSAKPSRGSSIDY